MPPVRSWSHSEAYTRLVLDLAGPPKLPLFLFLNQSPSFGTRSSDCMVCHRIAGEKQEMRGQ
jgi:hypothetical protein